MDATDVNVDESINFVISVTNLGEQDVVRAKGTIEIYNPADEKIATVYTEEKSIKTTITEKLYTQWKPDEEGEYKAIATVNYDGKIAKTEKTFRVGILLIKIIDYTKKFQKATKNSFDIEIKSEWNEKISNVYANILISDENDIEIANIKTPSEDVDPWGKKILTALWDIEDLSLGTYNANITLYYADKTTEKIVEVGIVKELGKIKISSTMIYIIIAICIILV
ncbi:unnamed protein product, partial [marine sediment metagenome]